MCLVFTVCFLDIFLPLFNKNAAQMHCLLVLLFSSNYSRSKLFITNRGKIMTQISRALEARVRMFGQMIQMQVIMGRGE